MVPIDDGTTRNILMHYGQVSLENTRTHAATYVNTPTRDAQDNDMFYYFLADSLTNEFRTTMLLYTEVYTVTNIPVASSLLKQIIILTRADNPASTMYIREMLIESKRKLVTMKGNITEFNQWVRKQMGQLHAREQEAVNLLYYLWKAYKAAPDEDFVTYIKDLKSQCDDGRTTFTAAEDLMVRADNKYEARLLDEENAWGKLTEEQEKIVAMSTEINSLKKERGITSSKTNKTKQTAKKEAPKKAASKKPTDKKKKAKDKWAWKNKPPKESDTKKMRLTSKLLRPKSIIGVRITTMALGCGHYIIQKTARAVQDLRRRRPMLISLLSTQWIATPNDCYARIKITLGSG